MSQCVVEVEGWGVRGVNSQVEVEGLLVEHLCFTCAFHVFQREWSARGGGGKRETGVKGMFTMVFGCVAGSLLCTEK